MRHERQVESPPFGKHVFGAPVVLGLAVALAIGAAAGSLITRAIVDRDAAATTTATIIGWDAGKLAAMEGRVLYEPSAVIGWDAGKLAAMEGRVLYERFGTEANA